jgi:hypothetical protein
VTEAQKAWIDTASYEELLRRWRNAPIGDSIFQGEAVRHYREVMIRKREEVGPASAAAASKSIGWDGGWKGGGG